MRTLKADRTRVTTSLLSGKLETYPAKEVENCKLHVVEYKGMIYGLAPKGGDYASAYEANRDDTWELVGEPYQSRRSGAQKARQARGGLHAWEQKALDDAVLNMAREYGRNGLGNFAAEDLFNNHGWKWSRVAEGRELSALAEKSTYWAKTQATLVSSSIKRLLKKGSLLEGWNSRYKTKCFVAKEFVDG